MKQLIAAIYISFGFLFFALTLTGDFNMPKIYNFIIFAFIITGILYLISDYIDRIRKNN